MSKEFIMMDQFHVTLEVDSTLDDATKAWLAKVTKQELKDCVTIAQMGVKGTLIRQDRNKFRIKLSQ